MVKLSKNMGTWVGFGRGYWEYDSERVQPIENIGLSVQDGMYRMRRTHSTPHGKARQDANPGRDANLSR